MRSYIMVFSIVLSACLPTKSHSQKSHSQKSHSQKSQPVNIKEQQTKKNKKSFVIIRTGGSLSNFQDNGGPIAVKSSILRIMLQSIFKASDSLLVKLNGQSDEKTKKKFRFILLTFLVSIISVILIISGKIVAHLIQNILAAIFIGGVIVILGTALFLFNCSLLIVIPNNLTNLLARLFCIIGSMVVTTFVWKAIPKRQASS